MPCIALYIGNFISPIQILVELIEMIQKGLAGFRRFLDVMETEPEIKDASDAEELTDVKGLVRYENVSFHYADDDTSVLSHISFEIPAGRSVALVGPSGSGKTTICSLLPRFYDVTGGRITIDGKDVRTLTLKKSSKPYRRCTTRRISVFGNDSRQHRLRKPDAVG